MGIRYKHDSAYYFLIVNGISLVSQGISQRLNATNIRSTWTSNLTSNITLTETKSEITR